MLFLAIISIILIFMLPIVCGGITLFFTKRIKANRQNRIAWEATLSEVKHRALPLSLYFIAYAICFLCLLGIVFFILFYIEIISTIVLIALLISAITLIIVYYLNCKNALNARPYKDEIIIHMKPYNPQRKKTAKEPTEQNYIYHVEPQYRKEAPKTKYRSTQKAEDKEEKVEQKSPPRAKPQYRREAPKAEQKEYPKTRESQHAADSDYKIKNRVISKNEESYMPFIEASLPSWCKLLPQQPLNRFIEAESGEYMNRIVDFLITNEESHPLFVIEINDKTHELPDRIARDKNVKKILKKAGIPLITFWTKFGKNPAYIQDKINEALEQAMKHRPK